MSEQQQYNGDKWTKEAKGLLLKLGWEQRGDSNFDIPCVRKREHATGTRAERKNDHGIDLFFTFFDPYFNQEKGIIVECKNRQWDGISKSTIEEWVNQLLMAIECGQVSPKIQEFGNYTVNSGLLMVWCNEQDKYDERKIKEYLSQIKIPIRKNPIEIFFASNEQILKWCSIYEKISNLEQNETFEFFYPSDYFGASTRSTSHRYNHLNLIHMYSEYIFGKSRKNILINGNRIYFDVHHIFFFAEPTLEELNFLYSLLQSYQLEDAQEIIFYFYEDTTIYRNSISEFFNRKQKYFKDNNKNMKISWENMIHLESFPMDYAKED